MGTLWVTIPVSGICPLRMEWGGRVGLGRSATTALAPAGRGAVSGAAIAVDVIYRSQIDTADAAVIVIPGQGLSRLETLTASRRSSRGLQVFKAIGHALRAVSGMLI